jgi:hypothetical protein
MAQAVVGRVCPVSPSLFAFRMPVAIEHDMEAA